MSDIDNDDLEYDELMALIDNEDEEDMGVEMGDGMRDEYTAPTLNFDTLIEKVNERNRIIDSLNNPTTKYNEDTEKRFAQFAKDLLTLYPGIGKYLSEKDIINRLKANIAQDIAYVDDLGKVTVGDQELYIGGDFDSESKRVRIKKGRPEIENSIYIFHEFIHALVENNPFSDYYDNPDYISFSEGEEHLFMDDFDSIFSSFIMEGITTIIQEDYESKILGIQRKRVNGYLPVYARQLKAIFGDSLIEDFIVYFKYIKPVLKIFYSGDKKISVKSLSDDNDLIEDNIRKKNSGVVAGKNSSIEITLTLILEKYLSDNQNLSDEEKLEKINAFLKEQIMTDFDYIKEIINKQIKDKSLIDRYPLVSYAYNVTVDNSSNLVEQIRKRSMETDPSEQKALHNDLDSLGYKYREYVVKKFFGFTNHSYDPKTRMLVCDGTQLQSYEKYKHLYRTLYELHKQGMINDQELEISSVKGATTQSNKTAKDQLLTGNTGANYNIADLSAALKQAVKGLSGGLKLSNFLGGHAVIDCNKLTHYMKISAERDYYAIADNYKNIEARFAMSIEEAIELYIELSNEIPELKKGYGLAIEELRKLNSEGITTVFVNEYGFIHDDGINGENVIIIFEDGVNPAELERESFELKELDMVFSKRDVKEL